MFIWPLESFASIKLILNVIQFMKRQKKRHSQSIDMYTMIGLLPDEDNNKDS